jgi:hypothetical protein
MTGGHDDYGTASGQSWIYARTQRARRGRSPGSPVPPGDVRGADKLRNAVTLNSTSVNVVR